MRHTKPRNSHNFFLILAGKGFWSLFYSIFIISIMCLLISIFGFHSIAMGLLIWLGSLLERAIVLLFCITALGAIWEAIA
jgi:hypothetical protein